MQFAQVVPLKNPTAWSQVKQSLNVPAEHVEQTLSHFSQEFFPDEVSL